MSRRLWLLNLALAGLVEQAEGHVFAGLERSLNPLDIFDGVDRMAIDLEQHIAALDADIVGERGRLDIRDQHTALFLDTHVLAAGGG